MGMARGKTSEVGGEKAMRDRVFQIINSVHVDDGERDAHLIANFIRITNGKIGHEIEALALRESTNNTFVIAPDEDIGVVYAHGPSGQDGKLNSNPFEPVNVPTQTFPSIT